MRSFMFIVTSGMALLLLAGGAIAQGRPDARVLSCGEARALVRQSGAVVFTTGRYTYDRYVANERFCAFSETIKHAWVPTRDTPSCLVGYVCVQKSPRDDFLWWRFRRH